MLTGEFYSYIPHNFGFQKAPIIECDMDIKWKLEMLASLECILVASRILEENSLANIYDNNYNKLDC